MKKILIVNKSFTLGGIQSSMINMANELSNLYKVDLFVYNPIGIMKERLNSKITILNPSWRFRALGMSLKEAIKSKNLRIILFRVFATVWSKIFDNRFPINCAIKHQPKLSGYDLAIAYHHEQKKKSVVSGFSRMVIECVDSHKKIAWLHYDSSMADLDSSYNNQFYNKLDKIVCVSKSLRDSFARKNELLRDKIDYCYNFMLYDLMREKSQEQQTIPYPQNRFICFSACRLSPVKALDRAIIALAELFYNNPDVVWYIAGDGPERNNIDRLIQEKGLEERIILIGNQPNPYPYMRNADLVLNVSCHEAAPMIFLESKALGTPVFATRTSSTDELLNDRVDSFVCDNSDEGIRETFEWILENKEMVKQAKEQLKMFVASNDESFQKIKAYTE